MLASSRNRLLLLCGVGFLAGAVSLRWFSQCEESVPHAAPDKYGLTETSAERAVEDLERVAVMPEDAGSTSANPDDVESDEEWASYSRGDKGIEVFANVGRDGSLNFRSLLLNPDDKYISASARRKFTEQLADATQKHRKLREIRFDLAKEQILSLHSVGKFHQIPGEGKRWQLVGSEPAEPGKGWYIYSLQDGNTFEIRWSDLPWTASALEYADFLRDEIDRLIVEFFYAQGAISASRRDLLLTYGTPSGKLRLRALAKENPDEYRRIVRELYPQKG